MASREHTKEPRLVRDPLLWCAALAFAALGLPFLVPGISRASLTRWTEIYAFIPVLLVVVASLEVGFETRLPRRFHVFRHTFAAAFAILFSRTFLSLVLADSAFLKNVHAGTFGYAYAFYYFLAFAAFAVVPHRHDHGVERAWLWLIRPLGVLLVALGLAIYFIGIPVSGAALVPAKLFSYVALDAGLITLALRLRQSTDSPLWRKAYAWFALGFGLGFAVDAIDLATRIGPLPWVEYGTPLDLLWFTWYAPMIVAARLLANADASEFGTAAAEDFDDERSWLAALGGAHWLVFALLMPILHLALDTAGLLDPKLEPARGAFTLLYVVCMGCVAAFHEHLLGVENRRLAHQHAAANEQLQFARRLEGIGQLAAGIAHDFNNKLTVIQASGELLHLKLEGDESGRKYTSRILDTVALAADVVRQLLSFSRKQISHPKAVDLNVQIEQIGGMLRQTLGEDVEVALELEPGLPTVKIDPAHVEQILINLALNARHAMPEGGRLRFRTEYAAIQNGDSAGARPAEVSITVSDSGVGMSDDVKARAFEPFFTTKPTGEGTGLGLATVFGLVQQNLGGIELTTEPGVGTEVRMSFPASGETAFEDSAPPAPGTGSRVSGRVLLVEDEAGVRELTRDMLESHGYMVFEAEDGDGALGIADHEEDIDILVTDVVMPGMSGAQLAREFGERYPEVKILFVSGYAAPDEAGVPLVPFVQKPFTRGELIRAIAALDLDAG